MRFAIRLPWLGLLLLGAFAQSAAAATIERFSPQGEIRSVRQVAVRFSEDMVKFGDPKAPTPFNIECAETGQGRWLDARAWVFDFSRDLPPGLRCAFKLKPEARALLGAALTGKTDFSFSTGGPAVLSSQPYTGGNVDEEQVFILRLNGPVHEPSVLANAWCVAEGIGERIPVAITTGQARTDFFKALKREQDSKDQKLLLLKSQQRLRFVATQHIQVRWEIDGQPSTRPPLAPGGSRSPDGTGLHCAATAASCSIKRNLRCAGPQ